MATGKGSKISALIDSCEIFDALSEEQKRAASLVVCANAQGKTHAEQLAWATDMLGMLGLLPGTEMEDYLSNNLPHFNGLADL